jgi:hypothetical protein
VGAEGPAADERTQLSPAEPPHLVPMLRFLKYFRRKIQRFSEKIDVFDSKQSKIMQFFDHNIGF